MPYQGIGCLPLNALSFYFTRRATSLNGSYFDFILIIFPHEFSSINANRVRAWSGLRLKYAQARRFGPRRLVDEYMGQVRHNSRPWLLIA